MTSYYVPTVVQTTIPDADMTPLERLILLPYLQSPNPTATAFISSPRTVRRSASSSMSRSCATRIAPRPTPTACSIAIVADRLAEVEAGDTHVELDLSVISWATIFQDVVRRSPTLDEVAVSSAFTCSRMRSDGFGGMATLITVTAISVGLDR